MASSDYQRLGPWLGVHHIGVVTHDLDASLHFYRDVLGLTTDLIGFSPRTRQRHVMVATGGAYLHLWEVTGAPKPDPRDWTEMIPGTVQHLALRLPDAAALGRLHEQLLANGVAVGDLQTMGERTFVMFHDPDGLPIEVTDWPDPA